MVATVCGIYQLLGVHVVQNPLSILTVMSTLHDSKETFRGIVLKYNINNIIQFIYTCNLKKICLNMKYYYL